MQILDSSFDVLGALCKASGKWGIYLSCGWLPDGPEGLTELGKAVPWLDEKSLFQFSFDQNLYALFDSETACTAAYNQVRGEDSRPDSMANESLVTVYAITCDPTGQLRNENT